MTGKRQTTQVNLASTQSVTHSTKTTPTRKAARLAARRLTKEEEGKAIYITRHMFRGMVLLKTALKTFFKYWGLAPRCEDTSEYLYKLIDYNEIIPNFISSTATQILVDNQTIRKAISARNAICHGNLPVTYRDWEEFLDALIDVTTMIGDFSLCTEFRRVQSHLISHLRGSSPAIQPLTVSLTTIFTSLESEPKTGMWTNVKKSAAIAISSILFDILIKDLAPVGKTFIDDNKIRKEWTSELDAYADSIVILQSSLDSFIVHPSISSEKELECMLDRAMQGRHAVCHDKYEDVLKNCEKYLQDWITFADAVHADEAASKIQKILNNLIAARSLARLRVKYLKSPPMRHQRRLIFLNGNKNLSNNSNTNRTGKWVTRNSLSIRGKSTKTLPAFADFHRKTLIRKVRRTMD